MKRKFLVDIYGQVEIEIDDAVINSVDDSWRKQFYDLRSVEEIVNFISLNMIQDGLISNIEGFADQDDENVIMDEIDWSTEIKEITDED
ncbi:MAG: hypothetical protein PHX80_04050 [Candidatus Nanoarchaeia archaeon]|nr:hypothetical protein [Candidatus Nanoarchaeia archaeon]